MPVSLPYLPSNKNVEKLFASIQSAKIPDKFSHDFLKTTLGLKGSNDRPLIPLLRTLGFIDQSGAPSASYRLLKNSESAKPAVATAIKSAYAPLFAADENAHGLTGDKLKGLIAQVAGTDDAMTARIASTFNALTRAADFSRPAPDESDGDGGDFADDDADDPAVEPRRDRNGRKPLQPAFHYNIQVHLPSNGTEDVYLNIFNALRKAFQ